MADLPRGPTIIDVAQRAGVSKSVVSRVFTGQGSVGEATRQRVLAAAADLGYVVNAMARGMVAHRTFTLGAFVRDAATPFYGHLLTAMQERAAERGYRVVTATGSGRFALADERRALDTLLQLRVEGLLVCSGLIPASDLVPLTSRVPLVVAGRPESHPTMTSVYCDEVQGGAAMADHVADLGHRHVAVLMLRAEQSLTMAPRTAAMSRRLRERGVEVLDLHGRHGSDSVDADEAIADVLAQPTITALMAPSDRYALSALEALARRGLRAPEDLSVTGYDGIGLTATPLLGITTWVQPIHDIGTQAVDAVVAQVEGPSPSPRHRALVGSLSPGRTAAAPTR